ncbi:MAG: DegT/DnrJ/EryC1/StrS family aminotransferase [Burkholderiales bacterium]|nr:DegT/DnrJ/EryC1/StrS family aminotransferase [Burkholderiales bacterium]
MSDPIQLFVPQFRIEECLTEIRECLEKGWTGLGFKTVAFEKAWCDYTGLPYGHFLSSATAGLHLAINVLKGAGGWVDGDEVVTTPLTFVSTNHAILYNGLRPVFADIDASLCLDPQSVLQRITPRTRAVVFVGMGGNTGRLDEIAKICSERGLKLVIDAAHMTGTRWLGRHIGGEADATVFSFQAVKNLPTADSGMICFRLAEHDELVRKLAWLGINKDTYTRTTGGGAYKWMYDVEEVGFKHHGNSIMAAIGLVQLRYVERDNAYRRQLASWYRAGLAGQAAVRSVDVVPGCESSCHLFQIRVGNRDALMLALNEHQVYPGVHYRDNTLYRMYAYAQGTCPEAARASDELISLPMHLGLGFDDVRRVVSLVLRYAR